MCIQMYNLRVYLQGTQEIHDKINQTNEAQSRLAISPKCHIQNVYGNPGLKCHLEQLLSKKSHKHCCPRSPWALLMVSFTFLLGTGLTSLSIWGGGKTNGSTLCPWRAEAEVPVAPISRARCSARRARCRQCCEAMCVWCLRALLRLLKAEAWHMALPALTGPRHEAPRTDC